MVDLDQEELNIQECLDSAAKASIDDEMGGDDDYDEEALGRIKELREQLAHEAQLAQKAQEPAANTKRL